MSWIITISIICIIFPYVFWCFSISSKQKKRWHLLKHTHLCSNRSLPNPTLDLSAPHLPPRPKAPGLSTLTGEPSWDFSGTGPRLDFFLEKKTWSKNVTSVCLEKNQRLNPGYTVFKYSFFFFWNTSIKWENAHNDSMPSFSKWESYLWTLASLETT